MYNVYFNNEVVNGFDTVDAAYEFALEIELNQIPEFDYKDGDKVHFDGDGCIMSTKDYNDNYKDEFVSE